MYSNRVKYKTGTIVGFTYSWQKDEHFVKYITTEGEGFAPIRLIVKPFFPVFGMEIEMKCNEKFPYSFLVKDENTSNRRPTVFDKYLAENVFNKVTDQYEWKLWAVITLNIEPENRPVLIEVTNFSLKSVRGRYPNLKKQIDYPVKLKVKFDNAGRKITCELSEKSDIDIIETIVDWQNDYRLEYFLKRQISTNSNFSFISRLYQNVIENMSGFDADNREKLYVDFLTISIKASCNNKNSNLYKNGLELLKNFIKKYYNYQDNLINIFFEFIGLWALREQSCNCIKLLNEDELRIWKVSPSNDFECISLVVAKTSEYTQKIEYKILFFSKPSSFSRLESEMQKKMLGYENCEKAYVYSFNDHIGEIRIKGLESKYLQFDCKLFETKPYCNPNCYVERHKAEIITDYSNKIPKDHHSFNKNFYVSRNIFSQWKEYIGTNGLYGVFSIRKSGKSTSLKIGLGQKTLYINLLDAAIIDQNAKSRGLITDYKYDLELFLMDYLEFSGKSLNDFDYIVIDEYEKLFSALKAIEMQNEIEGKEFCEKIASYIASISFRMPLILCGQDSTLYSKIIPSNNPLSKLNQLHLELFDNKDSNELIRAISKDNFKIETGIQDQIYKATAGHPRIIINLMCAIIRYLAKEKIKKGINIDTIFLDDILQKEGVENIFPLAKIMDPLYQLYTKTKLEERKNDEFYSLVLSTFQIYEGKDKLREEEIILLGKGVVTKENINILLSTNFLSRTSQGEITIKIPLLQDLYLEKNTLDTYLLKK